MEPLNKYKRGMNAFEPPGNEHTLCSMNACAQPWEKEWKLHRLVHAKNIIGYILC